MDRDRPRPPRHRERGMNGPSPARGGARHGEIDGALPSSDQEGVARAHEAIKPIERAQSPRIAALDHAE